MSAGTSELPAHPNSHVTGSHCTAYALSLRVRMLCAQYRQYFCQMGYKADCYQLQAVASFQLSQADMAGEVVGS